MALIDHPAITERYFFPRPEAPRDAWIVPAADGTTLACVRRDRGRAAAVLQFHGNGEVVADWEGTWPAAFDAVGIDCVLGEYRGFGGSAGRPSLSALLDDALAVFDAMARPAGSVIVYGRSIGSLAAAHVAAHRPVRALVLESGINDLHERLALRVTPAELGTTDADFRAAVAASFDQSAKVALSTCPVLVLHCDGDDMVRIHHAEANTAAAGDRGRLVRFPRGDHNTIHAHNHDAIVRAVALLC